MKQRVNTVLVHASFILVTVLLGLAALTASLAAETGYLPLVLHNGGSTIPGRPTQTATHTPTVTATSTSTESPTATPSTTATAEPTGTSIPTSSPTQTPTHTPTATSTTIPAPGNTITVTVGDNFFNPATVTINVGDTVVWVRVSGFHNVRADDGSFILGENAAGNPGATWTRVSHTFTELGTIGYHCQVHGAPGFGMAGTVEVLPDAMSGLKGREVSSDASHAVRATHRNTDSMAGTGHPPPPASSH